MTLLVKFTLAEVIEKYEAYGSAGDNRADTSPDAREIWAIALESLKKTCDTLRHLDYIVRYAHEYPPNPDEVTPERRAALRAKIVAIGQMLRDLGIEPEELRPPRQ